MELNNVEQSRDHVVIDINDKLQHMAPFVPECSIHRVPKQLLDMNRNAYVPKVISIGPFHRNQNNFNDTEKLKIRFFYSYQCRVGLSVEEIVEKVRGLEKKARDSYVQPVTLPSEEFVKMMVLDGCFIIEFMIMNSRDIPKNVNKVHSSFYSAIESTMRVELVMLENQLPIFVLQFLFDLVYHKISPTIDFPTKDSIELFEKVVYNFLKSCMLSIKNVVLASKTLNHRHPCHLLDFLSSYFVPKLDEKIVQPTKKFLPPSATQLKEAGIVFKKVEEDETCIMDINFKNGILNIPPLLIDDAFEPCARNLLAFAQFNREENGWYVIHNFEFLDGLLTTEEDVNLLVKKGIIINRIGASGKEIAKLFKNICKNITGDETNYFSYIASALKQHRDRSLNRWIASLIRNHFNTRALISAFGTSLIVYLTLLQTGSS